LSCFLQKSGFTALQKASHRDKSRTTTVPTRGPLCTILNHDS